MRSMSVAAAEIVPARSIDEQSSRSRGAGSMGGRKQKSSFPVKVYQILKRDNTLLK